MAAELRTGRGSAGYEEVKAHTAKLTVENFKINHLCLVSTHPSHSTDGQETVYLSVWINCEEAAGVGKRPIWGRPDVVKCGIREGR